MLPISCIALIETASIARGYEVADAVLKAGPVTLLWARIVSPGRYLVLISGDVEEVRAAYEIGRKVAGDTEVDACLIPHVHPDVLNAIQAQPTVTTVDALGVLETTSIAAILEAADRAAKDGDIQLLRIRLAIEMGGKGVLCLAGAVSDVEPAIEAASTAAQSRGALVATTIIPRPDDNLVPFIGA